MAAGKSLRRLLVSALSASTLEWYDFFIYGTAAALVFNKVFFPEVSPIVGTIAAFATFGVGFLFRPLGGIIFGHYGDRLGRKAMLVVAMLVMGVATFLIGLIPSYAQIGIAAPVILLMLRAVQGIAVGGQYGGAMLIVTENAPPHRRGFFGSFAQVGPSLAVILSNLVFLVVVASMSTEALQSWGWRIPFLLSAIVVALGLYIQITIEDSDEFKQLQARAAEQKSADVPVRPRSPIVTALREHPREVLQAAGMILVVQVYYYIVTVFLVSFATAEGVSKSTALWVVLISSAVTVASIPMFALVSDKVGRKRVLLIAAVATTASAFPFVLLLGTGSIVLMLFAALLPGITLGALYGPMAAFYYEMFPAEVRYSGASLGYQLGAVLGGGFAPLIATSLFAWTGTVLSVGAYVTVAGVLSIWAIASSRETYRPATTSRSEETVDVSSI